MGRDIWDVASTICAASGVVLCSGGGGGGGVSHISHYVFLRIVFMLR